MRTCQACGEDTEAGYAEPCTECGFSAVGEASGNGTQDALAEPESDVADQITEGKPKRSPFARIGLWLVIGAGLFGAWLYGLFDQPTGPERDQVESAIADSARQFDVTATVSCPEDSADTPVDGTFTCTATAGGRTAEIEVTNHEDNFEWDTGPLSTLK